MVGVVLVTPIHVIRPVVWLMDSPAGAAERDQTIGRLALELKGKVTDRSWNSKTVTVVPCKTSAIGGSVHKMPL